MRRYSLHLDFPRDNQGKNPDRGVRTHTAEVPSSRGSRTTQLTGSPTDLALPILFQNILCFCQHFHQITFFNSSIKKIGTTLYDYLNNTFPVFFSWIFSSYISLALQEFPFDILFISAMIFCTQTGCFLP
jgi:hypothetical protein